MGKWTGLTRPITAAEAEAEPEAERLFNRPLRRPTRAWPARYDAPGLIARLKTAKAAEHTGSET